MNMDKMQALDADIWNLKPNDASLLLFVLLLCSLFFHYPEPFERVLLKFWGSTSTIVVFTHILFINEVLVLPQKLQLQTHRKLNQETST